LRFQILSADEQMRERRLEFGKLSLLAAIIAFLVAILAVLFRYLISWVFSVAFADPDELLAMSWENRIWYALIPALGGLIVGPLVWWGAREAKAHGVPEVMDAVIRFGGRIRMRAAFFKGLTAAVTIGTGGSAGREGPIVHMGSAVGSNMAQFLKVKTSHTKILLGCGAAAAVTATFNTPIAGVLFAVELILMEFKTRSFIPLVIASVIATVVAPGVDGSIQHALTGEWPDNVWEQTPAFNVPDKDAFPTIAPWDLVAYLGLGIMCGLLALLFIRVLFRTEDFFRSLKSKPWLKPVMGGLLLGGIGLVFPWVHGIGYGSVDAVLNGEFMADSGWTLTAIIGLMAVLSLVKIMGVGLTLGSGSSGGIFAPALFIGAMAGGAYGATLNHFFPDSSAPYFAYAMVAMGALVAASTRGTLTAILMIFEMTQAYQMILPLLFACVIADMVASMGSPETIYTRKLLRRGINIVQDLEPNIMQLFSVRDVMVPLEDVITIHPDDALHKVVAVIRRTGHNGFPVIDDLGRLVGVVTHEDTRNAHNQGDLFVTATELMTTDMVIVTPYETGETALRRMGDRRISHLPVVDPYDGTKLMGWISKGDLVFAYEDYHRRMDQPITDEIVELEEFVPDETAERMEGALTPPSLMGRLFRGKAKEQPTDVQPVTEGPEVVTIELEEPTTPHVAVEEPAMVGKEEPPSRGERPVTAEEAGWEEEPASRGGQALPVAQARMAREEWEEQPAERPGKDAEAVDRLKKRKL
jgi:CIC family chloride channel protein